MAQGWKAFDEIEKGEITDASFVANLWRVCIGDPYVDDRYKDPRKFFERTYISEGLYYVLRNALQRVASGEGEPVILLRTTFGGGKTHTLIAIYHALTHPEVLKELTALKGLASIDDIRPVVIAFDGAELDPLRLLDKYGARNMWQFLALQLSQKISSEITKEFVSKYADPHQVPGAEAIGEVLRDIEQLGYAPVFLLDEVPEYVRRLQISDEKQAQATLRFIDSLARAVASSGKSLLVIAIPDVEQYMDINRLMLSALESLERVARPKNIVGRGEAAQVLRQALLKDVDMNLGMKKVDEYYRIYEEHSQQFPPYVSTKDFLEKMRSHYPFHPQYVDLLYDKISTLSSFQSTRDVLRLTARVLHGMHLRGDDGELVMVSDIDAANPSILDELLDRHGYRSLRVAVESDLEIAKPIDEQWIMRGLPRLALPVYSTVLVYSLAGEAASLKDITLATIRPRMLPHPVASILEQFHEQAPHLRQTKIDGENRYVITERVKWRRLVENLAREVEDEDARELFKDQLISATKNWGRRIFRNIIVWPTSPADISDDPSLKAIFLDPSLVMKCVAQNTLNSLLDFYAFYADPAKQQYREYRNSLIFFIPDLRIYDEALKTAKRIIAANRIKQAKETYALTNEDLEEINDAIAEWLNKKLRDEIPAVMYGEVYFPIGGKEGGLKYGSSKFREANPIEAAQKVLYENSKVVREISDEYTFEVIRGVFETGIEEISMGELAEIFAKDPEKPYVLGAREKILENIRKLVREGLLVLRKGDKVYCSVDVWPITSGDSLISGEIAVKKGLCVKVNGRYRPPIPEGCINPRWSEEEARWICEEEIEEESPIESEEEEQKPIEEIQPIILENATLDQLVQELQQKGECVLENLSIYLTQPTDRTSEEIKFLKSISQSFTYLEQRGYKETLSLFAEIQDPEGLKKLKLTGDISTSRAIREVLDLLDRLGSKTMRYELTLTYGGGEQRLVSADEVVKQAIGIRLLLDKYKTHRFSARARLRAAA